MSERLQQLQHWLQHQIQTDATATPITNDASFRRYFRVIIQGIPHIVMDAPPEKEDCHHLSTLRNVYKPVV
ncbi:MAG: hypothetical protein R3E08_14010 [Thiotrichaceae bacterium]